MSATALTMATPGRRERDSTVLVRRVGLTLRCPACGTELDDVLSWSSSRFPSTILCPNCRFELRCEQGIWRALLPAQGAHYDRFVREYEAVRAAEGRGASNPSYYRALPYRDLSSKHAFQWRIRARSFRYFEKTLLQRLEKLQDRPLVIFDLGAGNGWLSYRLTQRGHCCVAVDLLTNDLDGLGAAANYSEVLPRALMCFQAEVDQLPFGDGQADCVIFNASLHYSEDYSRTLGEALRCLRSNGILMIIDSPWYSKDAFGAAMVQERRKEFVRRFGFPSDALASEEYLTDERLSSLAEKFSLQWTIHRPWYGLRWAMRPWIAKAKGRREPASFRIYTAEKQS
jgi:SAM-dependent methyltransferase